MTEAPLRCSKQVVLGDLASGRLFRCQVEGTVKKQEQQAEYPAMHETALARCLRNPVPEVLGCLRCLGQTSGCRVQSLPGGKERLLLCSFPLKPCCHGDLATQMGATENRKWELELP